MNSLPPSTRLIRSTGLGLALLLFLWLTLVQGQDHSVAFEGNVMIPMRDGTQLAAHIFRPEGEGPFPTLLMRSPYGKGDEGNGQARAYAGTGYAMVIQDCRGRGDSEGDWDPFRYDVEDGFDTQEWIGRQPWCNGSIGTMGGSYLGWTQWASAPKGSAFLKAMAPVVPFYHAYDIAYYGGAFQLALLMTWGAAQGGAWIPPNQQDEILRHLPLNRFNDQLSREVFYLKDWVENPTDNAYWQSRGIGHNAFADVTAPALNIGGWYDIFSKATLELTTGVRDQSRHRMARRNQFVVMGPWAHGVGQQKVGELDFGPDAALDLGQLQREWFDYWLRDQDTGVEDWPACKIFVMGENRWRDEHEWPLKRTVFTPYYLNGTDREARLTTTPPNEAKRATFTYDPNDPAPTKGGNNLGGAPAGPYDQTAVEQRDDVLIFTTQPLTKPVEVTGPITMILYAATSAKDTDFTAKLVDVHPGGKAYNICDGIIRARWRNGGDSPAFIKPGDIKRYEIDLWVTSNLFKAGHRIRVEISSSNFPRFDRNPNTGKPFGTDTENDLVSATQTIHLGPEHPSHVLLPVIPR